MSITYVRTRDGRVFLLPSSWFEDFGDCYRVDFVIYHTDIYKGSIDVANTFNIFKILKSGLFVVGFLFLLGLF